jgi:hypothetical protein
VEGITIDAERLAIHREYDKCRRKKEAETRLKIAHSLAGEKRNELRVTCLARSEPSQLCNYVCNHVVSAVPINYALIGNQ